eukprot:TRINITY_DN26804_c0_g1_i1.p1 TRINITY_DN26804_c0_g1~~TRINITY_DN26804_c0_g1_i1.p1  ORF type:complete len:271 (-),score=37.16 TRINITY_DN26804_c0_g1_i1:27-770(-)
MPPSEQKSMTGVVSDFVIDTVNPKFRFYSRPVLLAIVIGTLTTALVAYIFVTLIQDCSDNLELIEEGDIVMQEETIKALLKTKVDLSCIYYFRYIWKAGNSVKENHEWCFTPYAPRCDGIPENIKTMYELQGKDWSGATKACSEEAMRENVRKDNPMVPDGEIFPQGYPAMLYKTCPSALASFGAASGYAGLIELGLTVLIVGIFQLTGVIKGKDHSLLKTWIKEIASVDNAISADSGATVLGGSSA